MGVSKRVRREVLISHSCTAFTAWHRAYKQCVSPSLSFESSVFLK